MEIKESLEKIMAEVQKDPKVLEAFKSNPAEAAKKLLGDELPEGLIEKATAMLKTEGGDVEKIVETVKENMGGDKLEGALDALKKLL